MKNTKRRPLSRNQALIIAILCLALWTAGGIAVFPHARRFDFLNLYTGASMALHGNWSDIYTRAGQLAREQMIEPGRKTLWPFVRPPAYAVIMSPMALLPFAAAFWVWIGVQTAVLLGCYAWAWRRFGPEAVVWASLLFFGPLGIANGQDCALFLALLIGAFALGERKKFFASGLLLGLGMVKFHLFLLWPFVLLVQKRWRMLAGLTVCSLAQAILSVSLLGWGGLRRYADFILHLDAYYSPASYLNVGAVLLNLRINSQLILIVVTILVAGLVLWTARRTGPLWMTFALATAGSLSIGPHIYDYDGTMLLLPIWFVVFSSELRVSGLAAAAICTPLTLLAAIVGPPVACYIPIMLLIFALGLCVKTPLRKQQPVPAAEELCADRRLPAC